MSIEFPIAPNADCAIGKPPLAQRDVFPRSSTNLTAGGLIAIALGAAAVATAALNETQQHLVGWIIAATLIVAGLTWVLTDGRTLMNVVRTQGPFEPANKPRLALPALHLMMFPTAAIVVLMAFGDSAAPVSAILIAITWAVGQGSSSLIGYALIPADSVEATLQRNAAAISFLIVTTLQVGIGSVSYTAAGHSFKVSGMGAAGLVLTPVILSLATYGIVTVVLKRRLK